VSEKWFFSDTKVVFIRETGQPFSSLEAHSMRPAAIDELDELPPPRSLPLRRCCSKRGCRGTARPGGRYCRPCATIATRAWRDRHRARLTERERARNWSDEQRAVRAARAYVYVYIRRGKLAKGRCAICNDPDVQPTWRHPRRPLEMEWFCHQHAVERREAADAGARETAALRAVNEEVKAAIALLPLEVQRELHEQAMGGLLVRRVGDMMYWWNLRRAVQAYELRTSGDGFFL
jgi:hypothetical protein